MNLQELVSLHIQTKAWEKDNFFQSLCEHQGKNDLLDVYGWLCSRAELHLAKNSRYTYEWKNALRLAACACLSTLQGDDIERICGYVLDPLIQLGVLARLPSELQKDYNDPMDRSLAKYDWVAPANFAWARDSLHQFRHTDTCVARDEIAILLYAERGVPAKLSLEIKPSIEPGLVHYPDPRYMTFVQITEEFRQSFQQGLEFAWFMAKTQGCPSMTVRWKIARNDGEILHVLQGASVGAAFALALVKLLSALPRLQNKSTISQLDLSG